MAVLNGRPAPYKLMPRFPDATSRPMQWPVKEYANERLGTTDGNPLPIP